jgi:hypothetical protein
VTRNGDHVKRVRLRPGKIVVVSDDAIARARAGVKEFGVTPETLAKLAEFKGDITIGPRHPRSAKRSRNVKRAKGER